MLNNFLKNFVLPACIIITLAIAIATALSMAFPFFPEKPPAPTMPFPVASPGPIEVELQHTTGKFTFRLGGTGYPVVIDPGSGKRWILLPTKED